MAVALVSPGAAVAHQYFACVGTCTATADPSSGTATRIAPGRTAAQPSTISRYGSLMFAANQASDNVVIHGISHQTSHLDSLEPEMHVSQPGGIALVGVGG
jgi:6-phosphogluconolactonase (cycloisomerase 2 family)